MTDENFSADALVLVGHGSTINQQSSEPVRRLANELAGRNIFAMVSTAFNLEEPKIDHVPFIEAERIFIVPITISQGHFTEETIPFRLGLCKKGECDCPKGVCNYPRIEERDGRHLIYCHPVGTHPNMTEILLSRARRVVSEHPFPKAPKPAEIALFIAGHGTNKNKKSREAIEAQVDLIRARDEYADVRSAFMEEAPFIADCYSVAELKHIVMVPFFIADGLHTVEDIPVLLGEPEARVKERHGVGQPTWRNPTERNGKLIWYSRAIGNEPKLPDVILELVREMTDKC